VSRGPDQHAGGVGRTDHTSEGAADWHTVRPFRATVGEGAGVPEPVGRCQGDTGRGQAGLHQGSGAPDPGVRKIPGKVPGTPGESGAAANLGAIQDGRQGVQATQGRDRAADRPHQWKVLDAQLVADPVHLRVPEPGAAGRLVPGLRGGVGDAAQGRHEPGCQGVRSVSDPDAGRVDLVAVRRRRWHHARGAAGQPVRAGRDGQRAASSPADAT